MEAKHLRIRMCLSGFCSRKKLTTKQTKDKRKDSILRHGIQFSEIISECFSKLNHLRFVHYRIADDDIRERG